MATLSMERLSFASSAVKIVQLAECVLLATMDFYSIIKRKNVRNVDKIAKAVAQVIGKSVRAVILVPTSVPTTIACLAIRNA